MVELLGRFGPTMLGGIFSATEPVVELRNQDASLRRGDSWRLRFAVVDESGAAVDLSTATLAWGMRLVGSGGLLDVRFATPDPAHFDLAGAAGGIVVVKLEPAETASFPAREHEHALEVMLGGVTRHVASGYVNVLRDVVA